jgi:adenine-specific DNA-methyltransferase
MLVRAFVESRGLTVRRNTLVREALEAAPSPDGLLSLLRTADATLDFPLMIRLLESRLTHTERKTSGAVYTPQRIVHAICERASKHVRRIEGASRPEAWRVLDPAVGVGAFLVGMAEHLHHTTNLSPVETVERQLYGVDVEPESTRLARLLLNLWVLDAGEDVAELRTNLLTDDALSDVPLYRRFGLPDGFDLVIGNPPYVRIQNLRPDERERLRALWYSARTGNIDLYIPFIESGLREINAQGVVGYIVPTTFTSTEAGRSLRELLSREQAIVELLDFDYHQVFENATTYSCLLFLSKQRTERFRYTRAASALPAFAENAGTISVHRLNARRWQLYADEAHATIQAIESAGTPLGRLARIGAGIATLADDCYLLDGATDGGYYIKDMDGTRHLIEPELTRPILKASRLKAEEDIARNRERILFPYRNVDGKNRIVPETVLRDEFPRAYAYLRAVRERLDRRDRGKPNPVAWYAFGRSQGLDSNFGRQLLTSGLNVRPNFVLCEDEITTFYAGYCVQPRNGESLRVLQRILNSPVLDFYIHQTSRAYQHGYRSFAKAYLERFGVPTLSSAERTLVLALDDPNELAAFLLEKYDLPLGRHAVLREFIER